MGGATGLGFRVLGFRVMRITHSQEKNGLWDIFFVNYIPYPKLSSSLNNPSNREMELCENMKLTC